MADKEMFKYKITVVTVCLNAEKLIRETIDSVLIQRYSDFEYLVIDGLSMDTTVDIIHGYQKQFEKRGVPLRLISESDNGIYDAMNKAAKYAEGEWVIYMNAGDTFFNSKVLEYASKKLDDSIDMLYGNIVIHENERYKLVPAGKMSEVNWKNPVHHQAAFTKTELLRRYGFDTSYKLVADYDLLLRLRNDNARFLRSPYVFASFLMGGVSNAQYVKNTKEMNQSRKINRVPGINVWMIIIYYSVLFTSRNLAKKIMGEAFYSEQRGWSKDKIKATRKEK